MPPSPPSRATGVTLRGFYDVSGLKSDADIMIWLHGGAPEAIQSALRRCAARRCCPACCPPGT